MIALAGSPDAALVMLLAGILLVYFECNRPGSVVPGCLGTLLILLALDDLYRLPLRPESVALAVAALFLILLDAFARLRGLAAAAGGCLLAYAFCHLLEPFAPANVHLITALLGALVFSSSTVWLAGVALRARRNKRVLETRDRIAAPHRID